MKKFIFPAIALLALFIASCTTKFKIAAPYKNITVVDGLLDEADTAHYIRIQKAFLDQNKSALTMAQNADSNFYSNISVKMEQIDFLNLVGGGVINTYPLTRVDMNLEGYQKSSGVFFNSPNYGYKFKNALDPNYSYRLIITNLSTGEVDSAETPIIDDSHTSSTPTFGVQMLDNTNLAGLGFYSTTSGGILSIICSYATPANYSFYSPTTQSTQTAPMGVAQAIITFNWLDSNLTTGAETYNSFNYDAGYDYSFTGNNFKFYISDLSLYYALLSNMKPAPANIGRVMLPCNLTVYLSTPDFANYMQIAATQGTGLTANQIEPVYTNVSGANTVGLFTSRGSRTGQILISQVTIDSLQLNSITSSLNIIGNIP